jgi:hypothetical protein
MTTLPLLPQLSFATVSALMSLDLEAVYCIAVTVMVVLAAVVNGVGVFPPTVVDEPSTTIQDPTEIWVGKLADSGPLCGENHVARFAGNLIRKHPIRESAAENHSFPGLWRDTNLSLNTDSEIYVEEPCSQQLSPQVSPFMGFDSPDSSHSRMEWPDTPSIRRTPVGSRDGMDFEKGLLKLYSSLYHNPLLSSIFTHSPPLRNIILFFFH